MMVRMLVAALVLATVLPATDQYQIVARGLSNVGIFALFFFNGLRLSRSDVVDGLRNTQLIIPIILWCFGAMAMAGYGLYWLGSDLLPPLVAMGLLYLGVMPSTVQSATAYSSMANGNVASSVVIAGVTNVLGIFVCAPIFASMSGGAQVDLGYDGLTKLFLILLLPFTLGQILQSRLRNWMNSRSQLIVWLDRSAIAIAVYVAFSAAVEQDVWGRLDLAAWGILFALLTALLVFAFYGAWSLSGIVGLTHQDRISFTFAGAHKSIAMGAPLALILFPPVEAGLILVPLLIYHLLQLIVSAPVADRFRIMSR